MLVAYVTYFVPINTSLQLGFVGLFGKTNKRDNVGVCLTNTYVGLMISINFIHLIHPKLIKCCKLCAR